MSFGRYSNSGAGGGFAAGGAAGFGIGGPIGGAIGGLAGGLYGAFSGAGGNMKRMAKQLLSNPGMVGAGNYYFPNMSSLSIYGQGLQGSGGPGGLPMLNGAPLFPTQGGGYGFLTNQGSGFPGGPSVNSLTEWLAQGLTPEELEMTPGVPGGFTPGNSNFINELGFPNVLPGPETAPMVQFMSEKAVAERNQRLGRQATGVLGSGLNSLQAYRPGGAQSLLNNTYGQLAQSYLAQQTEAPNVMTQLELMMYGQTLEQAKQSGRQSFYGNIIGGGISAAGGLLGGALGFAEGGVVPPRRGGTGMSINGQKAVTGEAGEHEVVAPLSQVKNVAKAVAQGEKEAGATVQGPQPNAGQGASGGAPSPANPDGGKLSSKTPEPVGGGESQAMQPMGGLGIAPDELDAHFMVMDMQMNPGKPSTGSLMLGQLDELLVEDDLWAEAFSQ